MNSHINPPLTRRVERIVAAEEVIESERVVLNLSVEEFVALWALHYIKGGGNTLLRYEIEEGLTTAMTALSDTSALAREVKKQITVGQHFNHHVYDRIEAALSAARAKVALS